MNHVDDPLALIVAVGVWLSWFVFAAAFLFRKKSPPAPQRKHDRASLFGILLVGVGYALIWTLERPHFTPFVSAGRWLQIVIALLTLAISVCSVWITLWAIRVLGKQWSVQARIVYDHKLITSGPYGLVRHPIYLGMFGLLVATGLALSYWYALLPAVVFAAVGTIIRIRHEERLLEGEFGREFEEYKRNVAAFLPFIY